MVTKFRLGGSRGGLVPPCIASLAHITRFDRILPEMSAANGQFSLRALLLTVAVIATFIALYVQVWRFNHVAPALFTTAVMAAVFLAIQRRREKSERLGAVLGGAIGGILSITLHKIACDVLLPDAYEHEGLPAFEFTLLFSPVGAVCGMIVGLLVWMFAFLLKRDAEGT